MYYTKHDFIVQVHAFIGFHAYFKRTCKGKNVLRMKYARRSACARQMCTRHTRFAPDVHTEPCKCVNAD